MNGNLSTDPFGVTKIRNPGATMRSLSTYLHTHTYHIIALEVGQPKLCQTAAMLENPTSYMSIPICPIFTRDSHVIPDVYLIDIK